MPKQGEKPAGTLALVALAAPVAAYFFFVALFGVNVPFYDDFGKVAMIDHLAHGRLTFADLWQQQNEHRLIASLVLVELPLAALTHWNLHVTMFASALLLLAATWLLLRMWSPQPLQWAALPIVLLAFTTVQFANILLAWTNVYIGLLGVLATLALLGRSPERRAYFWAALAVAFVTTYTEFQGLFVWPAAAPYLIGRPAREWATWVVAAFASIAIYFLGFSVGEGSATAPHVSAATLFSLKLVAFPLVMLGGLFTGPNLNGTGGLVSAAVLGLGIAAGLALALATVVRLGWRSPELRLPLALAIFSALHVGVTFAGRANLDLGFAASSRYATYTALLLIAAYLVFDAARKRQRSPRAHAVWAVAFAVIAVQFVVSSVVSWEAGSRDGPNRALAADILVNYDLASDDAITTYVWCCPRPVRDDAAILERDGLSVFATGTAQTDRDIGIVPDATPPSPLPAPPAIAGAVARDPATRLGWTALSAVYARNDLLRTAFPAATAESAAALIHWAAFDGPSDDASRLFLEPYGDLYRTLDERLRATVTAPAGAVPSGVGDAMVAGTQWSAPAPFAYDPARGVLTLAAGTSGNGQAFAGSAAFFVAPTERYRFSADVDARGLLRGRVCFYAANVPLGESLGMACATPGVARGESFEVTMPQQAIGVRWAALADGVDVGARAVRFDHLRVQRLDAAPLAAPQPFARAGLDDPAGRSRWYLPPGSSFASDGGIDVRAPATDPLTLYVPSETVPVLPGWTYTVSGSIDARALRAGRGCIYLALVPSGLGVGMSCAAPGTAKRVATTVTIPGNVWLAQWTAFANGAALAPGGALHFDDVGLHLAGGSFAQPL